MGNSAKHVMIPFPEETEINHIALADGKIVLSPFAAKINSRYFGITFWTNDIISVVLKNGEEYLQQWEDPAWKKYEEEPKAGRYPYDREKWEVWSNLEESVFNTNFSVFADPENTESVYFFKRVLDLDEVKSVIINGVEYPVD